jgi:putative flippase GtrA
MREHAARCATAVPTRLGMAISLIVCQARARPQLMRFAIVGLSACAAYYGILAAQVELLGAPVMLATSVTFIVVCVANYAVHRSWTFASDEAHASAIPKFLLMVAAGFLINWCVMFAGVSLLNMNYLLIQVLAIAAVVAWNYVLSFFWVFRASHARLKA